MKVGGKKIQDKILQLTDFVNTSKRLKASGYNIVFTNGCFDLMHIGHLRYLEAAKNLGDYLMVAINNDNTIKRLKDSGRPINILADRMEMLASLYFVDYVTNFDDETPIDLIKKTLPNFLVKGGDWPTENIVGANEVLQSGGRVLSLPLTKGKSSSALIEKILNVYASKNQ